MNNLTRKYELPNRNDLNEFLDIFGYPLKNLDDYKELKEDIAFAIQILKNERLIGMALITKPQFTSDTHLLYLICVDPHFQRKGFGSSMMNEILEWQKNNASSLKLFCDFSKTPFYNKFGFLSTTPFEMQFFDYVPELTSEL